MATIYRLPGDTDDFVSVVDEGDTKPATTGGTVPQMVYSDGTMGPITEAKLSGDLNLEIPAGNISGKTSVNKFGRAVLGVQTTATDIWDRADAATTQQIWTAPTAARMHQIKSTSDLDGKTASPNSVGARTIRIFGLTGWSAVEVSEDITMNGTTNVATTNAYVIIHRMRVLTKGATNVNVGIITATADTNATVTAEINAGEGQTQMAIYGVPDVQTAYMTNYYVSMPDVGANPATANAVDVSLLVNPEPDAELKNFLVKHTQGISNTATSHLHHPFNPYFKVPGPCIVKVQCIAFNSDTDVSAGFDIILVTN